jgi:hypothetical protein
MPILVPPDRHSFSSRLRAFLRESVKLVAIALVCLAVFAVVFFASMKTGIFIPWRWIALSYWTGFLIWIVWRQFKQSVRQPRFWIAFAGLLVIHTAGFVAFLQKYPGLPGVWFAAIVIIEAPCFSAAIEIVLDSGLRPRR